MTPQQEREALERMLKEATYVGSLYGGLLQGAQTPQQREKLQARLNRYNALRTLIADLMLG